MQLAGGGLFRSATEATQVHNALIEAGTFEDLKAFKVIAGSSSIIRS